MNFQYAQPSQTPVPAVVYAILNAGTVIAVAFDLQDAQTQPACRALNHDLP